MDEKLPPHNVEAEQAVLGAVLIDPHALSLVGALVRPEDFQRDENREIFAAMLALQGRGAPVDALTLYDELGGDGHGGTIVGLANAVPTSYHAEHYARIVARLAARRRLIDAGARIAQMAWDEGKPLDEAEAEALDLLVAARAGEGRQARPLSALVGEYYDEIEALNRSGKASGLPTGFKDVDAILGGLHAPDLALLAARPGVGKTSLALGIALNAAQRFGATVAVFSLEMSASQVAQRLAALDSAVPIQHLREGTITEAEWPALIRTFGTLNDVPVFVDDTPGVTPAHVRAASMRVRALAGLDLVVVDYVQLMRTGHRSKGRYEEVTEISQALKALAKDLDVPVLALSQLNRDCETRADKRPTLSDLRDSGSLEQDADVVVFLYRDELYDPDTERPNIADAIVAKHRNGRTASASLYFEKGLARFRDAEVRTLGDWL